MTDHLPCPVCSAADIYGCEMINAGAGFPFIVANRPARQGAKRYLL